MTSTPVLEIAALDVGFDAPEPVMAVREVSLSVNRAECVGVVGESGSGKTQLFMAVLGLLPAGGHAQGSVRFEGQEILALVPSQLNRVRGSKLTMVFQDPMTSLTPHLKVGVQLAEVLVCHAHLSWRDAERAALEMLERVHVPDAARRLLQYPHELSGGMRQRVMIGMGLLCEPALLIADEPTTALDVTVQAQIIALLRTMREKSRMALVLVSHDVGVVAELADRIVVMYAGRIVESATASSIVGAAQHPYTAALLECVPRLKGPRLSRMHSIPGTAPAATLTLDGCAFAPRCARARERCRQERPALLEVATAHRAACHYPLSS